MKLISYVNSIVDCLDMEGLTDFAASAQGENRHVTWLTPPLRPGKVTGHDHLRHGVVVIWEGDANTLIEKIREEFLKQWELDINGEGEGLSG